MLYLDEKDLSDERWFWPVEWLKATALMPHKQKTFLCHGHTVQLHEPTSQLPFAGVALSSTAPHIPGDFTPIEFDERSVDFLSPIPLHSEELQFAIENTFEDLLTKFSELGPQWEPFDPRRPNVCPG